MDGKEKKHGIRIDCPDDDLVMEMITTALDRDIALRSCVFEVWLMYVALTSMAESYQVPDAVRAVCAVLARSLGEEVDRFMPVLLINQSLGRWLSGKVPSNA